MTTPGQQATELLRTIARDLVAYHAGHRCRRCEIPITDHEYIESGLFMSLCGPCLASARQTLREAT